MDGELTRSCRRAQADPALGESAAERRKRLVVARQLQSIAQAIVDARDTPATLTARLEQAAGASGAHHPPHPPHHEPT